MVRHTVKNYVCPFTANLPRYLRHSVNGTALNLSHFRLLNATATFYDVHK